MKRSSTQPGDDIYSHTAFLITDVARRYRISFDARVKDLKLHRSEWWLLRHLRFFGGSTQAELTEVMDITKGGMGKLIDRLERDGLVKRTADGKDRRTNRVYLTAKTKSLSATLHAHSEDIEARALAPLSRDEIAMLNQLLDKMRLGFLDGAVDQATAPPRKSAARKSTRASGL